ncbi:MAG TPA: N-acetyl-gamma-glutamyl-phosphate reductase [Solirubrobacterales bacterium]|nr:N-acetyl-gamma-glutamyl-phosphate reductase [Solirubrobacterales bacterium]
MPHPRVLVAGALGAVGSLVAELLDSHPHVELAALTARETGDGKSPIGKPLSAIYPEHRVNVSLRTIEDLDFADFDAAVVAYPAGPAASLVRQLRMAGLTVVDSCGDFRFTNVDTYEQWYGVHGAPELNGEAVYGLPELNRDRISEAKLVGNPGCYPTASILALAPLARNELVDDVVIDAKSGVSGAGKREGGDAPGFIGTHENMRAYGVPGHRHEPEIEEKLSELGYLGDLSFVPHLIPIDQGELVSCYVKPTRRIDQAELDALYQETYSSELFVEMASGLPEARDVQRTNICRIHPVVDHDGTRIFVFATIDNLWKGGASQAVQNLNLALGLDEKDGIPGGVAVSGVETTRNPTLDRSPVSA